MNEVSLFYIIIGLAALITLLLFWIVYLEWRLRRTFRGQKAKSLEGVFADFGAEIDRLIKKSEAADKAFAEIGRRLTGDISKCHTIRFNPFKDHGGNQSFSTCLINEKGDGVVISGLYSREKVNVYAKPLVGYASEYELSAEEKEAIREARKK